MMRHHVAGFAGVLTALALAGCTDSKSILHVDVTGDVQGLFQMEVDISVGGMTTTLFVPSPPRAITLPTSFNVEMDHSRTGALDLVIHGNDEGQNQIASGSGHLDDIDVGGLNTLEVPLSVTPSGDGPPDGGSGAGAGDDASPEAGGEEGSADGGVPDALAGAGDEVAVSGADDGGVDVAGNGEADDGDDGEVDGGGDAADEETGP